MSHAVIGLIVGIIMGLTGAGGALISIPLFISLHNTTLKEATVLSLVAVIIGTAINLFGQFKRIDMRVTLAISIAGIIANYATLFLKPITPDLIVVILLSIITAYSLWSVWSSKKSSTTSLRSGKIILKATLAGALLGTLTTLTGLGGGIILIPILINQFGKSYNEALPSSLATILLISLSSLVMQSKTTLELITFYELGYLLVGVIASFMTLKLFMKNLAQSKVDITRKIVFSLVAIYSTGTILRVYLWT